MTGMFLLNHGVLAHLMQSVKLTNIIYQLTRYCFCIIIGCY